MRGTVLVVSGEEQVVRGVLACHRHPARFSVADNLHFAAAGNMTHVHAAAYLLRHRHGARRLYLRADVWAAFAMRAKVTHRWLVLRMHSYDALMRVMQKVLILCIEVLHQQIAGAAAHVHLQAALVQVGNITYQVMLPGYCVNALSGSVGLDVSLCTMEYLEGTPGKGNLIPRMVGFLTDAERDFFNRFISVKGIGIRKGLRSLSLPIGDIASAIEGSDEKMLQSLPAIGKRMAQQIIAELKGKLGSFAIGASAGRITEPAFKPFQAEALEILIAWGEKRNEAMELIELACKKHPNISTAEDLVPLVYRVKQGIEV